MGYGALTHSKAMAMGAPAEVRSSADWLQKCAVGVQTAAIDESSWTSALRTIREALHASGAALETWDHRRHSNWSFLTSGLDVEGASRVHELFPETNPRLEANSGIVEGEVAYDYQHWDETQLSRLDYVRAMEEHTGTRYYLAGVALKTCDHLGAVTFFREPRQGHFSEESIERLRVILPLLKLALQTSILIDQQRKLASLAAGESTAVILLNSEGRVIFANAAAERLEAKGLIGGLQSDQVLCHSGHCRVGSLVQQAVHGNSGAIRVEDLPGGRALEIRATALAHSVLPLEPLRARAALLIRDPAADARADPNILRDLFGLSDREQQVAQTLLAGRSTESVASELGISRATVRVHLRNLLQKTDTHSQHELVSRLSVYR